MTFDGLLGVEVLPFLRYSPIELSAGRGLRSIIQAVLGGGVTSPFPQRMDRFYLPGLLIALEEAPMYGC